MLRNDQEQLGIIQAAALNQRVAGSSPAGPTLLGCTLQNRPDLFLRSGIRSIAAVRCQSLRLGSSANISARKSMNTLTLLARNRAPGLTALMESFGRA